MVLKVEILLTQLITL